jgi:hypothetical protein
MAAAPGGLVREHPPGLPESLIGDGAGHPAVAGHPGHVQVLGHDGLVPEGEDGGGFVQGIDPDAGDSGMDAG